MQPLVLPKNATQIFIKGQLLQFETICITPQSPISGVAIIFHPDPKAGGTNTNKVVQQIAKSLTLKGYICYCPNLRGVGKSTGVHDNGVGEIEDALEIYNYVTPLYPDLPVILGGFSFGTSIASNLALKVPYHRLILAGLAVSKYNVVVENHHKTFAIHGDEDEIIPLSLVLDWAKKVNQAITVVPNCGHFFHGKLLELAYFVDLFI